MADSKISALPAATTPLAGTEVLPIVQGGTTDKVTVANLTAGRAVSMKSASVGGTVGSLAESIIVNSTAGIVTSNSGITINAQCTDIRYNWLIGAQYNLNQGFEITPSTVVGGGTFSTPAWSIDAPTGNVKVGVGNLVIGTSGKGIDFSATPGTGTSELLADYEEGTWTPTNPNAITVNSAKYTKIGRIVICTFDITAGGSATTGDMLGLPFNATNPTAGGVVSVHNENGTEVWSINIEAANAPNWSFRLGSTQKQLSAGKNAKGMITYSL
jgi:hypothetical protein